MGWETVSLKDINPTPDPIGEGEYTFQLLPGAKIDDRGSLAVSAAIVSEGDFRGRRLFMSYPDPTRPKCEWSAKALKVLEIALGIDANEGESPVEFLNRAAGNGAARFTGTIYHRKYTPNEGADEVTRAELRHFSVRPSA